jgi:2-amino-4-hydroxy-6-hydroxymethyldihydropteridine diphosphokinase
MTWCLIALGSNIDPARERLRQAAAILAAELQDARGSKIHRSAPMYREDQDEFLNACLCGQTPLGPLALLDRLQDLEHRLGRIPRERNGPREIDLDLAAYGPLILESPRLKVPHPRLAERRFVLEPACEIAAGRLIPGQGSLDSIRTSSGVEWQEVESIGEDLLL